MKRSAALFLLLVLSTPIATLAADWPTHLYDNARRGATNESLAGPLALQWVYTAPAPPEMAWGGPRNDPIEGKLMRHRVAYDRAIQVVAADGKVYFGSSVDHQVYCVDAETGEIRWQHYTDGPIRLAPTLWQGKVYVGSDDGFVYCLNGENGQVVWKLRVGPADERLLARGRMISRWPVRTGVAIQRGIAYFGAGVFPHETVYLCAADAASGKIVWRNDRISQTDAGRNDLSPQGYLLATDEHLFVPSGRSLPAAFDRDSGEMLHKRTHSWRTTAGGVVGGYKAVLSDGQLYTSGPHHFLALDQKTGSTGYAWITGTQLVISADKGFVADGKRIAALDRGAHTKATIERQKLNLEHYSLQRSRSSLKPAEFQRRNDELTKKIAELSEVGILWSTPSTNDASLISAGDKVFAGGAGSVVALDAETGKSVWQAEVEGQVDGLAAANGRLLVSTDLGKIYCFAAAGKAALATVKQIPATRASEPFAQDNLTAMYQEAAAQILRQTGV